VAIGDSWETGRASDAEGRAATALDRELDRLVLTGGAPPDPMRWRAFLAGVREALEQADRRLTEAEEVAQLGSWEWDLRADEIRWSAGLRAVAGMTPSDFGGGFEGFLARVHADDREMVAQRVAAARSGGEPLAVDLRITRPDGAVRTLAARGKLILDEAGVPRRMVGTAQDVTEARRLEDELRRSGDRVVSEAAAMMGDLDVGVTLKAIAGAMRRALAADRATCYVHAPGEETIAAVYTTEADPARRAFLEAAVGATRDRIPIWDYLLSQADPFLVVEDVANDPRIGPRLARGLGSGAFLGIRLEHPSVRVAGRPELLGTIFCSWAEPGRLTSANRADARGLTNLAALALANARLHADTIAKLEENAELAAEQAALRRVATTVATADSPRTVFAQVAREAADLLGVECGLVARYEPGRAVAVGSSGAPPEMLRATLPLAGDGALAQVAVRGRAVRVADYGALAEDPVAAVARIGAYRSAVAAPVRVEGRLWGAVMAATTRPAPISPDAERRLSAFAELLELAIGNALSTAAAGRQATIHRAVLETANDAFVAIDATGAITDWNRRAEAAFGWSREEALGRPLADTILAAPARGDLRDAIRRFVETGDDPLVGRPVELVAVRRDGAELPVEMTLSALALEDGHRFSAFIRDIADRKRAERHAEAQHAVSRALAESATLAEAKRRVLRVLGERIGWDLASLWTVDRDGARLRCVDVWAAPDLDAGTLPDVLRAMAVAPGEGLPGRVWAGRRPDWVVDADPGGSPRAAAARAAGLRSAVALPVLGHGEVLSVIELARREPSAPEADLVATLIAIGGQLGQFVERKRAEREAERLKDEFFTLVSHELRTPLTSIIGYLEELREAREGEPLEPEEELRFLGILERNARRLERLVGDLLFVARLEEGKLRLERSRVDLTRLAEEAVEVAAPMAERSGIRLGLRAEPIEPCLGDPGRLGQVLDNLIGNAVKFTRGGGRVDVLLARRDDVAVIEIADTGVGIPADEQRLLFQRFFRASTATRHEIAGVGLGLTVVKAIVEAHGGSVAVESARGRGSTFRVELPLRPVAEDGLRPIDGRRGRASECGA
jgi:PAS domain S-box-containing protein